MGRKLIGIVVAVVVVAGAAVWWLFLRSDTPDELSVQSSEPATEATGTAPESLDGSWVVVAGDETTAGLRITESFAGGLTDHTAVGRSDDVSGSITVAGAEVTEGSFTVNLRAIEFTDDPGIGVARRANAMKTRGLETDEFPEATLTIAEPIDLGEVPAENDVVSAEVVGELTLHGVTNQVSFTVEAQLVGDTLRVATADPVPVALADYDIEKPTGGPIAEIADEGSFEFLVIFTQE